MNGSPRCRTRSFFAGSTAFSVECPSELVLRSVEALLVDLPQAQTGRLDAVIDIVEADDGRLSVNYGEAIGGVFQRPNNALSMLVSAITRLALDNEPEFLHLHGATVELEGRGALISAASGIGKTTFAAALVAGSWTYLSDESVALNRDASTAMCFAKPLMLKSGARDLLPKFASLRVDVDPVDDLYWHVPASAVTSSIVAETAPAVVVFLHRRDSGDVDSPSTAEPISRADAVVALMAETLDAQRFGPDAVHVLARLAARCACVRLPVGPLTSMELELRKAVESPVDSSELRLFEGGAHAHGAWRVPDEVRSVSIDGRVVVHNSETGAVAALDEVGSGVWTTLLGEPPEWWDGGIFRTPATLGFLERLASLDLVEATPTGHGVG